MTLKDLKELYRRYRAEKARKQTEPNIDKELIRLNHLVMELAHETHNNNMLEVK